MKTINKLAIGTVISVASMIGLYKSVGLVMETKYTQNELTYMKAMKDAHGNVDKTLDLNILADEKKASIDSLLQNLPELTVEELTAFNSKQNKDKDNKKAGNTLLGVSLLVAYISMYSAMGSYLKLRKERKAKNYSKNSAN